MKALSAVAILVLSVASASGAQASTFAHWCERAVKQRMLTPSAYHRVGLVESVQPILFFDPSFAWLDPEIVWTRLQHPRGRLSAFVDYEIRNRYGVPLRSAAKCVYGRG